MGYAFAAIPLIFGHVLLTSTLDLLVWPASCCWSCGPCCATSRRWWLAAGAVVGLSMYNKLLIAMLLVALAPACSLVGPRRLLVSRWVLGPAALALVIGSPNLIYQATHDWPELTMGRALADNNGGDVHVLMWPFLLSCSGPPLAAVWVAGLVALWRRPAAVRFLAAAFPVLLVLVFVAGTPVLLPVRLLVVLFAAGCVPAADLLAIRAPGGVIADGRGRASTRGLGGDRAAAGAVAALGDTPIPAINQTPGDSVGWPRYVAQVAAVYRRAAAGEPPTTRRLASNYGEAGAVARFGPASGCPPVYSAQNQLYSSEAPGRHDGRVVVGGQCRERAVVRALHGRGSGWTTARTSTTRSRASRSPYAAIRSTAGRASGRHWPTSTDASGPAMSSKPTMLGGLQAHQQFALDGVAAAELFGDVVAHVPPRDRDRVRQHRRRVGLDRHRPFDGDERKRRILEVDGERGPRIAPQRLALHVSAPVLNSRSSPSITNQIGATCGRPSARTVASLPVRCPSARNS